MRNGIKRYTVVVEFNDVCANSETHARDIIDDHLRYANELILGRLSNHTLHVTEEKPDEVR